MKITVNLRYFLSLLAILSLCLGTAWASESKNSKETTEAEDGKESKESKEGKEGKEAEKVPAISRSNSGPLRCWWRRLMADLGGVRSPCL